MSLKEKLTPNLERAEETTATGAAVVAAAGSIVVYFAELLTRADVPAPVEGAIVVVAVYLVARFLPAR